MISIITLQIKNFELDVEYEYNENVELIEVSDATGNILPLLSKEVISEIKRTIENLDLDLNEF
jgi:hypothetical protein